MKIQTSYGLSRGVRLGDPLFDIPSWNERLVHWYDQMAAGLDPISASLAVFGDLDPQAVSLVLPQVAPYLSAALRAGVNFSQLRPIVQALRAAERSGDERRAAQLRQSLRDFVQRLGVGIGGGENATYPNVPGSILSQIREAVTADINSPRATMQLAPIIRGIEERARAAATRARASLASRGMSAGAIESYLSRNIMAPAQRAKAEAMGRFFERQIPQMLNYEDLVRRYYQFERGLSEGNIGTALLGGGFHMPSGGLFGVGGSGVTVNPRPRFDFGSYVGGLPDWVTSSYERLLQQAERTAERLTPKRTQRRYDPYYMERAIWHGF